MTHEEILAHAAQELGLDEFEFEGCTASDRLYVFPQTWPDSTCGFDSPQISLRALWVALTYLLQSDSGACAVYIHGEHAYTIHEPTGEFQSRANRLDVPSPREYLRNAWVFDKTVEGP